MPEKKQGFTDRVFGLLEGPVASSLVKLLATGIISLTTVTLVAVLAFSSAQISILLSTIGIGFLSTAVIWIFGSWRKQGRPTNLPSQQDLQTMKAQLATLEDRLSNVEIIERFEDRMATMISKEKTGDDLTTAGTIHTSTSEESES